MNGTIDPVTLEVVRHALTATAEEMSLVVMRSARSPLLREAGDLSSALTDADGHLIAQGRDIPMHMGVMSFTVREFLKRVPKERLEPGDVWFLNLPEVGGNHLPDVKAIRPIYAEGEIVAFAASLAHWADIGGACARQLCRRRHRRMAGGAPYPALPALHRSRPRPRKARHGLRQRAGRRRARGRHSGAARSQPGRGGARAPHRRRAWQGDGVGTPSPRSTTGPRRRCARRSRRFPTAPIGARTGSTTMPAAAGRLPFAFW